MTYKGDFHERLEPFDDPEIVDRIVIGLGVHRPVDREYVTMRIRTAQPLGSGGVAYFRESWFLEHPAEYLRTSYGTSMCPTIRSGMWVPSM